jgi:hypothetical protein
MMSSFALDSNDSRKRQEERTRKRLEKYLGKIALMRTWEQVPSGHSYYLKLKMEAHKLRETLITEGVL